MLDNRLYLINGQTVRTGPIGNSIDYLVVGSNSVPNHKDLDWTVKYVEDNENMFGGAEHAFCIPHGGMGEENLKKVLPHMTFIEGHNSQLIFDKLGSLPVFSDYKKGLNIEAQNYAKENNIPWIATSDAHRIEDAGLSYIEFDVSKLDTSSGDNFVKGLKTTIESKDFSSVCNYMKLVPWMNWVSKFMVGVTLRKDKE